MYDHHRESIERTTQRFANDPEVRALLLGGSVAHGFATPTSDIDVLIVVDDAAYEDRRRDGRLQYFDPELCTYDGGYVDGKYLGVGFLRQVAERGSDPARFAFKDAQVLLSQVDGLDATLRAIRRYPVAQKPERIQRFYAQFETWHWYAHEALKLGNRHLLGVAVGKLVLFGGRLVLVHNELLYPYHKWFLTVLERAPNKPAELMPRIAALYADPSADNIRAFYETVLTFRSWECNVVWPTQFMLDSELNWLDGRTPVDDL